MSTDTFHAWACTGKDQPLVWQEFKLKQFEDDDIEMDVTNCGICGSDLHTMDSGWGPTNYPCVVGHEVCVFVNATLLGSMAKCFLLDRLLAW